MHNFVRHSLFWLLPALASGHSEQHVLYPAPPLCPLEPFGTWRLRGICPINEITPSTNETIVTKDDVWMRGDVCHEIPGGSESEFCTFTYPSFNGGLGVSIVTTPAVFEKVANLPVFEHHHHVDPGGLGGSSSGPQPADSSEDPSALPRRPYRDVPIPGKGIGLVTTRPLAANEIFMARTPAVMVDDTAFRRLGRARLTELLTKAVDDLPPAHRAEYLNLTTHDEVKTHAERVYQIFMKNNFNTPIQDLEVFHSAFTQVSRLNHACRPNSDYFFDDNTLSHNVFAARDVPAGEELTVTYSDPVQTHMSRQNFLLHHWGFACTCSLCTASETEIETSDAQISQIRALWADLDDYSPGAGSAATPDKAERLIDLYRAEGLVTRMVEAYYRAAVEWNGVGDSARARQFAERSIREGEVMESGIRPFMNNMRELARNPEGHWTWRFRVRDLDGGGG